MPHLHCPDCKQPLAHFSSFHDVAEQADGEVKQAFDSHRPFCQGRESEILRKQRLFSTRRVD